MAWNPADDGATLAEGGNNRASENAKYLDDPKVQTYLTMIRKAEGADYNTNFGGSTFDDYSKHPGVARPFKQTDGKANSTTAAGGYQYLKSTWDGVAKKNGLTDFSPRSQDIGAVELLRQSGSLNDVLKGDYKSAVQKDGKTWASLPSSPYAQPKRSEGFVAKLVGGMMGSANAGELPKGAWNPADDGATRVDAALTGAWNPADDGAVSASGKPAMQKQAPYTATPRDTNWADYIGSGSKPAAAALAFIQGSTLGFGDEIGAGVNSLVKGTKYDDELAMRRGQVADNKAANPGLSTAVEMGASIPAYMVGGAGGTVAKAALGTAAVGGASALGAAEGTPEEQAKQAALGTIIGGAAGAGGKLLTNAAGAVVNAAKKPLGSVQDLVNRLNPLYKADKPLGQMINGEFVQSGTRAATQSKASGLVGGAIDHGLGAVAGYNAGSLVTADTPAGVVAPDSSKKLLGAVVGGGAGLTGLAKTFPSVGKGAAKLAGNTLNTAGRVAGSTAARAAGTAATNITTQALVNMSKPQAKKAVSAGNAQIQEAVNNGQPEYAAKFSALQNPVYRQGVALSEDKNEDDEDYDKATAALLKDDEDE